MELDFIPGTGAYVMRVPAEDHDFGMVLMRDHGFDMSLPTSTPQVSTFFTFEPYAAATFYDTATILARQQLAPIVSEIDASWALSSDIHVECPTDKELWDFQKADIAYGRRRANFLVGDQPGLGKTPIAICTANDMQADRVLVICPASIRVQWVQRIREWSTMKWPMAIHPIFNARNGVHPNAKWTVVSYELARSPAIAKALLKGHYDLLILDEAHYLKTIDARRTRAIFGGGEGREFEPLYTVCDRIMALTGTPLPNRPREAYTLARGLNFDSIDWMSEKSFGERFNPIVKREIIVGGRTKYATDERTGRHAELQNRLRSGFMTRHLKRDVMPQLKYPEYGLVYVEETGAVKSALRAESMLEIDPEQLSGADAAILGEVATVRRMMGIAMAPQVCDYIDMLIEGGEEKLVLFGWHKEVLDIYQHNLAKHGVVRVDGSTSSQRKDQLIKDYIAKPEIKIIVGNLLSLGTGTDGLQLVSNHALIGEPSWTPGENIQGFDRLDRGGQKAKVQGDIFVAENSFAERILASSLRKLQTVDKALDNQKGFWR